MVRWSEEELNRYTRRVRNLFSGCGRDTSSTEVVKVVGEKVEGRAVSVRQEGDWGASIVAAKQPLEAARNAEVKAMLERVSWQDSTTSWVEYPIAPVTKPRQTRSDKWKKRPCVIRYREYADKLRALKAKVPESGGHVTFVVPLPKSWSEKRKKAFDGAPHKVKPDADNLLKALLDALHKDDSHIWDIRVTKVWGRTGAIRVKS